jgi:hypothetical protein
VRNENDCVFRYAVELDWKWIGSGSGCIAEMRMGMHFIKMERCDLVDGCGRYEGAKDMQNDLERHICFPLKFHGVHAFRPVVCGRMRACAGSRNLNLHLERASIPPCYHLK